MNFFKKTFSQSSDQQPTTDTVTPTTDNSTIMRSSTTSDLDIIDVATLSDTDEDDPVSWILPDSCKPVPNALKKINESFEMANMSLEERLIREQAIMHLCLPAWTFSNSFPEQAQQDFVEAKKFSSPQPKLDDSITSPVPKNISNISAISNKSDLSNPDPSTHTSTHNISLSSSSTALNSQRQHKRSPLPSQANQKSSSTPRNTLSPSSVQKPTRSASRSRISNVTPRNSSNVSVNSRRSRSSSRDSKRSSPRAESPTVNNRTASPLSKTFTPSPGKAAIRKPLTGGSKLVPPRTKSGFGFKKSDM